MLGRVMSHFKTGTAVHACDGQCEGCGTGDAHTNPSLSGWKMAASAAGVFLLPLFGAALGAGMAGASAVQQTLGALAGAATGVALARAGYVVVAKRARPRAEDSR